MANDQMLPVQVKVKVSHLKEDLIPVILHATCVPVSSLPITLAI